MNLDESMSDRLSGTLWIRFKKRTLIFVFFMGRIWVHMVPKGPISIEVRVYPKRVIWSWGREVGGGWAMPRSYCAAAVAVALGGGGRAHPPLAPDYQACARLPCMDPTTLHGPET